MWLCARRCVSYIICKVSCRLQHLFWNVSFFSYFKRRTWLRDMDTRVSAISGYELKFWTSSPLRGIGSCLLMLIPHFPRFPLHLCFLSFYGVESLSTLFYRAFFPDCLFSFSSMVYKLSDVLIWTLPNYSLNSQVVTLSWHLPLCRFFKRVYTSCYTTVTIVSEVCSAHKLPDNGEMGISLGRTCNLLWLSFVAFPKSWMC